MAEAEVPVKPFILAISPGRGFEAASWSRLLESPIDGLMIREPQLEARALLEVARWCQARRPDLELWVRGRLDVALRAGCGLHAPEAYPEVPQLLVPLSRPLHAVAQLPSRQRAAQLLLSPVFPVPGKGPALGVAGLHGLLDQLHPYGGRVLALGGLEPGRVAELAHPRLNGVALIRALWEAPSPTGVVEALRRAWA